MSFKKFSFIFSFFLIFLFSSCTQVYFDKPQPIDGKNTSEFPKSLQGRWIKGKDTVLISNNYYSHKDYSQKIITKKETYGDSAKYLIKGDLIYSINSDNELFNGYVFEEKNDTIIFNKLSDNNSAVIGHENKLIKLSKKYYSLNILEDNKFYQSFILDNTNDGIIVWKFRNDTIKNLFPEKIDLIYSKSNRYYLKANLTKNDLLYILNRKEEFLDTIIFLDNKNKK